jgi:DICT domain-containing protein
MGRRLPAQSPCRLMTYGAIALTDTPALAREGHDKTLPARCTACPAKSEAEDATGEVRPQLPFDVRRNWLLSDRPSLEPAFEVLCDDLVERRLLWSAPLVAAGTRSADVRADYGPRRRRSQHGDHGHTGTWTG